MCRCSSVLRRYPALTKFTFDVHLIEFSYHLSDRKLTRLTRWETRDVHAQIPVCVAGVLLARKHPLLRAHPLDAYPRQISAVPQSVVERKLYLLPVGDLSEWLPVLVQPRTFQISKVPDAMRRLIHTYNAQRRQPQCESFQNQYQYACLLLYQ